MAPDAAQRWLARQVRIIPAIVATMCLIIANGLWVLRDEVMGSDFFPELWPYWMLAAGFLCFLYAAKPANRWLMAASGTAAITGFAGRAIAVLLGLVNTTNRTNLIAVQAHIAGATYTLCAILITIVWVRVLRPATTLLERGTKVIPDTSQES